MLWRPRRPTAPSEGGIPRARLRRDEAAAASRQSRDSSWRSSWPWHTCSVIVHDLHGFRAEICPAKAHPPLVVDPDRMLTLAVLLQRFQAIRWWYAQRIKSQCRVQHAELAAGDRKDVRWKPLRAAPLKDSFGHPAPEA